MTSNHLLSAWLESEDDGPRSDQRLTALFEALPAFQPSPAFADAVMRELGMEAPYRSLSPTPWQRRAAVGAFLALAVSFVLIWPLLSLVPLPRMSDFTALGVAVVHAAALWWETAFSIWGLLFAIGEKASLIFLAPEAVVAVALTLLTGLFSFRWLLILTRQHRSSGYAESA